MKRESVSAVTVPLAGQAQVARRPFAFRLRDRPGEHVFAENKEVAR